MKEQTFCSKRFPSAQSGFPVAVRGLHIGLRAKRMGGTGLGGAKWRMNRARLVPRQRRMHAVGAHGERADVGRQRY